MDVAAERDRSTRVAGYLTELFGLQDRTAVVTGATSGLGAACAVALAAAGADVVVCGRDRERGERVVATIAEAGGTAGLELANLADADEVRGFARRVLDRHEHVDILVNAAGIFLRGDASDAPLEDWQQTFEVNVTATFLLCQAFGRRMIERGHGKIVNFASTDGVVGVPEQAAYCASKGAVIQLTRTLGAEWITHGINVNAIGPCDFETPMVEGVLNDPEYRDWILQAIPAGRVGRPPELAGAVVYLASAASDMVVGHTLLVDGGRTVI
jgi:NAD(P)-dependent dehydrogenase (short-subunit alcohol dehydrogenase family)